MTTAPRSAAAAHVLMGLISLLVVVDANVSVDDGLAASVSSPGDGSPPPGAPPWTHSSYHSVDGNGTWDPQPALLLSRVPATAVAAALRRRKWPSKPTRWASSIAAFVRADRAAPPPEGGIVFVGSSTIRLWKNLSGEFPGLGVIGRGFGGSQLPDSTYFAPTIIVPYRPRQVVLFAGSNDLAAQSSPQDVAASFAFFVAVLKSLVPRAHLSFLEITSSPSRWGQREHVVAANSMIKRLCNKSGVDFIPVRDNFLESTKGKDGTPSTRPRADLFAGDRLHLNAAGYRILADAVRPFLVPP